ncbi:phytanoyl-CoA dioxygenase family protein [Sphingomonas sp. GM_Shp_1]|uniref:phytanoyl-CoA dioxygenase family protein n=1 Tax=Sphingomonas sp. GM_Shp_1 TaxID=2937381 RepID=UPI00226B5D21|nr:phytanoyl-CoA dioxygenase family protein [Sphingomonas sp. GM_Shp_1]
MMAELDEHGYALRPSRLDDGEMAELAALFADWPSGRPGQRIDPRRAAALTGVRQLVADRAPTMRPVRALLFDKADGANWALAWHQDRTIEVVERREVAGFGPWTVKQGRVHVAPPVSLLERMVTVRFHLDPVDADNAPLIVAPGSHRLGLIPEPSIEAAVARHGDAICLAEAGSVWLYRTLILHASARSSPGRHRRVLQIDLSADELPDGLRWACDAESVDATDRPECASA